MEQIGDKELTAAWKEAAEMFQAAANQWSSVIESGAIEYRKRT